MTNFTIGCDPEIFLQDEDGNPMSAHGIIPGTKHEPFAVTDGAVQVDGLALELNTNPVSTNDFNAFNTNVVSVLGELKKMVKEKYPKARFNISPVQDFGEEFLAAQPDEAKELGCDPDYNAYTMEVNPRPDGTRPFRTGAGHLHFGWGSGIPVDNEEHHAICADFVRMLDATVGLVMTYLDRDPRRRELYGMAGAYRTKHYGVEYRTPSNRWLTTKASRSLVFYAARHALSYMQKGFPIWKLFYPAEVEIDIQSIINNGDHARAEELVGLMVRRAGTNAFHEAWSVAKYEVSRLEAKKAEKAVTNVREVA